MHQEKTSNRFVVDNHDAMVKFLAGIQEMIHDQQAVTQIYHESLHQIFSAYCADFKEFSTNLISLPKMVLFMRSDIITSTKENTREFLRLFNDLALSTWFTVYENRHFLIQDGNPKFILDTVGPSYLVLYEVNE